MASEIQCKFSSGRQLYALVRGLSFNIGKVWNTSTSAWDVYATASYANYTISLTEQGSASGFYAGNFPSAIAAGSYSITVQQQIGGSAAETDPTVASGNFDWNGSYPMPISDLATSGQLGMFGPFRPARGVQILKFPVYLKSSADHVTPLVSGVLSGQISRDGGAFGALQSGAFSEVGLGWYTTTLTSGDLLANTIALLFGGVGVSGGVSDPLPISFITQRTSGAI